LALDTTGSTLKFSANTSFTSSPENGLARREGTMSDGSPAAEVRFEAGAFGQLQKPPHALQTQVISGEFEFTLGGDTRVVRAGESLILPANVASGCFCLSAGVLLEIPQTR
jgi:quercetin dioxygenase-like cupin family protein